MNKILLILIVFGIIIDSTEAHSRTCISMLPRRLTSEYEVAGWQVPLALPNRSGLIHATYSAVVTFQIYSLLNSFGNSIRNDQFEKMRVSSEGSLEESISEYQNFFSAYTRPLVQSASVMSQMRPFVAAVYAKYLLRKKMAPLTFLTYGAYQELLNYKDPKAVSWISNALKSFDRKLEKTEKIKGQKLFEDLVYANSQIFRIYPENLAQLIVVADQLGFVCDEELSQLLSEQELLGTLSGSAQIKSLLRDIFKTLMRTQFDQAPDVTRTDAFMNDPFSEKDFQNWLPGFRTFIKEELGKVPHVALSELKIKVKYYKYSMSQVFDKFPARFVLLLKAFLPEYREQINGD